jgi:hypothetical protein
LVQEQRRTFAAPERESSATPGLYRNIQTAVSIIKIGGEFSIRQAAVRDHTIFTDIQMDTRGMDTLHMDILHTAILRTATRNTDTRVDQACRLIILPMRMSEVI